MPLKIDGRSAMLRTQKPLTYETIGVGLASVTGVADIAPSRGTDRVTSTWVDGNYAFTAVLTSSASICASSRWICSEISTRAGRSPASCPLQRTRHFDDLVILEAVAFPGFRCSSGAKGTAFVAFLHFFTSSRAF